MASLVPREGDSKEEITTLPTEHEDQKLNLESAALGGKLLNTAVKTLINNGHIDPAHAIVLAGGVAKTVGEFQKIRKGELATSKQVLFAQEIYRAANMVLDLLLEGMEVGLEKEKIKSESRERIRDEALNYVLTNYRTLMEDIVTDEMLEARQNDV